MKNLLAVMAIGMLLFVNAALCSTRIAVVSGQEGQELVDLLTANLSQNKELELVERSEIEKVVQEHQLSLNGALSQQVRFSQFVRADGVLMLDVEGRKAKEKMVRVRLMAADPGVVILDVALPFDSGKLDASAKLVSQRVTPLMPKLKVQRGSAIPISILNIRALLETNGSLEREVGDLLASRLTREPSVFVLERRKLGLLSDEKNFSSESAGAFWDGAELLDGSIDTRPGEDSEISITLRLRQRNGAGDTQFKATGKRSNLRDVVEKLAGDILTALGRQPTAADWDPEAEAQEYLDEAVWAWNQGHVALGIEAAESAKALGLESANLVLLYVNLLDESLDQSAEQDAVDHKLEFASQQVRLDFAMKAIDGCNQFVEEKMHDQLEDYSTYIRIDGRNERLRKRTLNAASKVLVDLLKHTGPNTPPSEPLTQAIRKLAGFSPAEGKLPSSYEVAVEFAEYWADGVDELFAYYKAVLNADAEWRKPQTVELIKRLARVRENVGVRFGLRRDGFEAFVKSLGDEPRTRLVADAILAGGEGDLDTRRKHCKSFLDQLWADRENLVRKRLLRNHLIVVDWRPDYGHYFTEEFARSFASDHLRLLHFYLQTAEVCEDWPADPAYGEDSDYGSYDLLDILWDPVIFPKEEIPVLEQEFKAYQERCKTKQKRFLWRDGGLFAAGERVFHSSKVFLTKSQPAKKLTVTKFWQPYNVNGAEKCKFTSDRIVWEANKLWLLGLFTGTNCGIYTIDLPSLATERIEPPGHRRPFWIQATPKQVFVSLSSPMDEDTQTERDGNAVGEFDRAKRRWKLRRLAPTEAERFYLIHDQLYLTLFGGEGGNFMSGIARYDWANDKLNVLADSRRKPELNQFDNCDSYEVRKIFAASGGKICAVIDGLPYLVREDSGKWQELNCKVSEEGFFTATFNDKTLLVGHSVVYIDPAKESPEVWMRPKGTGALWATPPDWRRVDTREVGFNENSFYFLVKARNPTPHCELRWYERGGPAEGRTIPMEFKLDKAALSSLEAVAHHAEEDEGAAEGTDVNCITHPELEDWPIQLFNTDQGIVLVCRWGGFWFIPFSDVRACLENAKQEG